MRLLRDLDGSPLLTGAYVGPTPLALLETYTPVTDATGIPFFVAEIEVFLPGSGDLVLRLGWNTTAWNTLSLSPFAIESTGTIVASDVGYRTRADDPDGVVPYPPIITEAFSIDREVPLAPNDTSASAAWGELRLSNDDGRFDTIAAEWNSDGRPVTILWGRKTWDDTRGIFVDPPYTDLVPFFVGIAQPWFLDTRELRIPLRDATYWLERLYQTNTFSGTGDGNGNAAVAGKFIPRTRGGTPGNPVRNVTPIRIASTRIIYQWSDGPGTLVRMLEGMKATYTADGDVGDLFSTAAPASGHYQTDLANSRVELGNEPVHAITLDVTGEFPTAGAITTWAGIARYMISEDMGLPAGSIDTDSFDDAATVYPYTAGVYFGTDDNVDGTDALTRVLQGAGGKLIPDRTGRLRCFVLAAPYGVAAQSLDETNICEELTPIALPASVSPPPKRIRLAHNHNYTVSTSDINDTADPADKQFAEQPDSVVTWLNPEAAQWRRPADPPLFGGSLLIESEAQTVADRIGGIWGNRARLYHAPIPIDIGLAIDIGDRVEVTYPMDDLRYGRNGIVVGEIFRSGDAVVTVPLLIPKVDVTFFTIGTSLIGGPDILP